MDTLDDMGVSKLSAKLFTIDCFKSSVSQLVGCNTILSVQFLYNLYWLYMIKFLK